MTNSSECKFCKLLERAITFWKWNPLWKRTTQPRPVCTCAFWIKICLIWVETCQVTNLCQTLYVNEICDPIWFAKLALMIFKSKAMNLRFQKYTNPNQRELWWTLIYVWKFNIKMFNKTNSSHAYITNIFAASCAYIIYVIQFSYIRIYSIYIYITNSIYHNNTSSTRHTNSHNTI